MLTASGVRAPGAPREPVAFGQRGPEISGGPAWIDCPPDPPGAKLCQIDRFMETGMKKFLLAGVASIALSAGAPANAADLAPRPAYKAPPVVAPVPLFSWTGCYIGAHIGGGWGRKEFSDTALESSFVFVGDGNGPHSIRTDTSGFLGGGQVGCD